MLVSGMAKWVREVATRIGAGIEIPAPPPTDQSQHISNGYRVACPRTDDTINERDVGFPDPTHQPVELELLFEEWSRGVFASLQVQDQFWCMFS